MPAMDISKTYPDRPTDTQADFDEVTRQWPSSALAGGLADAFRSDKTTDIDQMAASLFAGLNGHQLAGLLRQLIRSVGPALLGSFAGGGFARMLQGSAGTGGDVSDATQMSPSELSQLTPDQVRELATEAQRQDPCVHARVGALYAEHPEVVKARGGSALAIALGQVATRMRR